MMHHARTQTESLPLRPRAYSHRWLVERGLSSGLPDELRPRAERMYPVIADAVGIAVGSSSRRHREEAKAIEGAMSTKVKEMYADGDKEPTLVKREIMRVYEKWRG